jgi:transposase
MGLMVWTYPIYRIDKNGKIVLKKKIQRDEFLTFMANIPKCLIRIKTCSSSNHCAREISKLGHEAKLLLPQFVKSYLNLIKMIK